MSVIRLHFVVPLIAVYVCVRPLIGQALGSSTTSSSEGEAPVIPIPTATPSNHETLTHSTKGNGSGLISPHHDPLFGPHDPNRNYDVDEKKYFQVGVIDFERVKTPFIIGTWILAASLAKIGFHMFPKLSHMFPESCLLIVLGVLVGTILYFGGLGDVEAAHHLDPDIFFLFMLPPIILDAGYFMPNRLFFDNLGTILVFAVIGTIFNTFTIGAALYFVGLTGIYGVSLPILNTFVFASLISAVDPVAVLAVFEEIHVNEMLYIVVFGESLLNDAVTVVLYHMFEAYVEMGEGNITALDVAAGLLKFLLVAFGGVIVGVVWGFLTAFVTRFTSSVRVIEPLFVFVMAYLAYLNAEIFHMSGILSITFCGLTMKNYVISNVSAKSHTTIKYTMKMLSSSSETVIFMLLGVATVHNHHEWNTFFVFFTILFCSLFRSIGVLIFAGIVNQFRMDKIATVDKFVMAYGGLRGAVAFALVLLIDPHHVPQQQMFLTTTIAVVYFTVFVQGISVGPLVEKLGVKKSNKRELTMNERIHERSLDHIMAGVEDIVGHPGRHYVRSTFKHFNHKYLRPLLTHEDTSRDPKIMETFSRLALKDAMKSAVDDVINGPSRTPRAAKLPANDSWADIRRDSINWQHAQVSNTLSGRPARDISEATIQHLLGDSLSNVRQRRWSYSRHAVRDEDMHTRPFQHQIPVFERQRVIDMHRKRKIRNQHALEPRTVSESPSVNRVVFKTGESVDGRTSSAGADGGSAATVHGIEFVVGEDGSVSPSEEGTLHTTEVESVLPWKRNDETEVCHRPLKWHDTSAPAWIANEEYSRYKSPPVSLVGEDNSRYRSPPVSLVSEDNSRYRSPPVSIVAEDIHIDGTTSIPDSVSEPGRRRNSLATSFLEGLTSLRASFRRSQRKCSMPPRFDDSVPGGVDRKLTDPCCRMKPGLDVCADVEGGYVNFGVVSEDEANVQYRTRI